MPSAHVDYYAQLWNVNFDPNPFRDTLSDYTHTINDIEYVY